MFKFEFNPRIVCFVHQGFFFTFLIKKIFL